MLRKYKNKHRKFNVSTPIQVLGNNKNQKSKGHRRTKTLLPQSHPPLLTSTQLIPLGPKFLKGHRNLNPMSLQNFQNQEYLDNLLQAINGTIQDSKDPQTSHNSSMMNIHQLRMTPTQMKSRKLRALIKQEVISFVTSHSKCGENCPHLLRFYESIQALVINRDTIF